MTGDDPISRAPRAAPHTGPSDQNEEGDAALLRAFLGRHDAPCPMCGYSLKGLASSACPECGSAIVLQVKPAEPRMGWWTTGLIGLSSGFGFFLVATGFLIWAMIVEQELDEVLLLWPLWLGFILSGVPIAGWLRWSGRIRRMRRGGRISLAIGTWLYSGVVTIGLLWVLFAYVIF